MEHKHVSRTGLTARLLSVLLVLGMLCGVAVPGYAAALEGSADPVDVEVSAEEPAPEPAPEPVPEPAPEPAPEPTPEPTPEPVIVPSAPPAEITFEFRIGEELYEKQTLQNGQTLEEPETPTAAAGDFDGWYTEKPEEEKFTEFGPVTVTETKTVKLFAKWKTAPQTLGEEPTASAAPSDPNVGAPAGADQSPGQTGDRQTDPEGTDLTSPKPEEPATPQADSNPQGEKNQEEAKETEEQKYQRLYDQIMACEDQEELTALLEQMDEGFEAWAEEHLTEEQLAALSEKMTPTAMTAADTLDPRYFKATLPVYYDTATALGTGGSGNNGAGVSGVTLGGTAVVQKNSNNTGNPGGGYTVGTYFANANSSATLQITASAGYYVTGIVVACVPNSSTKPYNCSTWSNGVAYNASFNLAHSNYSGGSYTLSTSLAALAFCHDSNPKGTVAYYILIVVAPVPTPLYVEYDYGAIGNYLTVSGSPFAAPTWTTANSSNNYGTGGVLTNNTQFQYTYSNTSGVSSWAHYANGISNEAVQAAAAAGYYFAGWSATWYNNCTYTANPSTLAFSSEYATGVTYQPGSSVALPTHVRLVAQWQPIELTVTKTVTGLPDNYTGENTYTLQVQKQNDDAWENFGNSISLTVHGNGSTSETISPVPAGNYRVIETGEEKPIAIGEKAYNYTPTYSEPVTVPGESLALTVTNTYTDQPIVADLTITKSVTGLMGDKTKEFSFTYSYMKGDETVSETFVLKDGGRKIIKDIPIGTVVTVTEDRYTGYMTTYVAGSGEPETGNEAQITIATETDTATNTVAFTNHKDATPDTGVPTNSLPYVLMLMLVAVGGGAMLLRRKHESE